MYEELEPVDSNLKYDFDYQQFTHLKHEVIIKPVSVRLKTAERLLFRATPGRHSSTEMLLQNARN